MIKQKIHSSQPHQRSGIVQRFWSTQGFTLIELLLYAGIAAIVTTAVGSLLILSIQSRAKQQVIEQLENTGAAVIADITQEVRNSDDVAIGTDVNGNPTLTITTFDLATDPIVYALSGDQITKKIASGSAIPLSSSHLQMTNLTFSVHSAADETRKIVDISFTLQTASSSSLGTYEYTKDFFGAATIRTP